MVKKILSDVKAQGDEAVKKYTKRFDGVAVDNLQVSPREFRAAATALSRIGQALKTAAKNIEKFHKAQLGKKLAVETMKGVECWRESRPIERVGLYIPKGLISTVLMLGIPARIAGCKEIIMCTPPQLDKSCTCIKSKVKAGVGREMLVAAKMAGIKEIFKIGGAQAIAAMAYGTETLPKVDKLFGPGNQYVTAAKLLVSPDPEGTAIDLPAGPSEILIIADAGANPNFVAADLLSQAEHGPDSQIVLATLSQDLAAKVKKELRGQLLNLPEETRKVATDSLKNGLCVVVGSLAEAIDFANLYAPEHLVLDVRRPESSFAKIKNAGSVFVGGYSPVSVGDYASGTNHVLPTSGFAKSYSGVSVDSFLKKITFQKLTKSGLKNISAAVAALTDTEEMPAHKRAVATRLGAIIDRSQKSQ